MGLYRRGKIWWLAFSENGKQVCISTRETDRVKAEAIASDKREQQIAGPAYRGYTLEQAIADYVGFLEADKYDQKARKSRHVGDTQSQLDLVKRELGNVTLLSDVTTTRLQKWFDDKVKIGGVKVATAAAYLIKMRRLFKYAIEKKRIRHDPTEEVLVPKYSKKPTRNVEWIRHDDMNKLIDNCLDRELKYILYCGFHAGLRFEEVTMSRPEWFDLDAVDPRTGEPIPTMTIQEDQENGWMPKDRDKRTVPLTDEFAEFLRTEYPLRGPYMIAPNVTQGKSRYRFDFGNRFHRYKRRLGFPNLTFHMLRHSFVSQRINAGVSITKVAGWIGDGVQVVEDHYGHLQAYDREINLISAPGRKRKVIPLSAMR
jgi:integrase